MEAADRPFDVECDIYSGGLIHCTATLPPSYALVFIARLLKGCMLLCGITHILDLMF